MANTEWRDRGIKRGDLFLHSSDTSWRLIESVPSNTGLNLVTVPGSMDGAYTIRRTFVRGVIPGKASMAVLNNDLYVACQGGGEDPSGVESAWCIIKVTNIFSESPDPGDYVLAAWNITGNLETQSILSGLGEIRGIVATQDGRLVILATQDGSTNRVLWSSPTDVTDWTGPEAGFTDLVPSKAEGKCLRSMSVGGREALVVLFMDSITVGYPTGQTDVPYEFVRSKSAIGTRWYRGACEYPGGLLFVGSDGHFYAFDGTSSAQLTDDTIRRWTKGPDELYNLTIRMEPGEARMAWSASFTSFDVA